MISPPHQTTRPSTEGAGRGSGWALTVRLPYLLKGNKESLGNLREKIAPQLYFQTFTAEPEVPQIESEQKRRCGDLNEKCLPRAQTFI